MPSSVDVPTTPYPIQGNPGPGYGAVDVRRALSAALAEGVVQVGDLLVTQRAGGAGMAVDVAAGEALVQNDLVTRGGLYHAILTTALTSATEITVSAANATNPRIDRIVLEIKDTQYDGSGLNKGAVRCVAGTATAGATLANLTGAAAVPSSAILLANVLVPATATTIPNANIADVRVRAVDPRDARFTEESFAASLAQRLGLSSGGVTRRGYAEVLTDEALASGSTNVDLATVGPVVTINVPAGALVFLVGENENKSTTAAGTASSQAFMDGAAISSDYGAASYGTGGGTGFTSFHRSGVQAPLLLRGVSAGPHNFKMVYSASGGVTSNFRNRKLWVWTVGF